MKRLRGEVIAALTVAVCLGLPSSAEAQFELWETDSTYAELNANLQILSAYLDFGDLGTEELGIPEDAGMGGAVGRLEWYFDVGSRVDINVHNRFFWQTSPLLAVPVDADEGSVPGFDVSAGAERRVSTETTLVDGDTARLTHDLDRAVVGMYFGRADLYLGRQAIRWGVSDLFGVADRFAPLSPFELDTLQRRGIDAARVVTHLSPSWELDFVVADRGEDEWPSIGGRIEYFGTDIDVYGAGGRFWNRLSAMAGVSYLTGNWKFFGEGEALWNLDDDDFDRPRATVGAQRVGIDHQFGLEYYYNGFGVSPGDDYGQALLFPPEEVERGETYFVGQHYAGVTGMYISEGGWGAGGGAIANVVDPSVVVFPTLDYEIDEQFTVTAGAYLGLGEGLEVAGSSGTDDESEPQQDQPTPEQTPPAVSAPSEFGASPDLYFVQMTAFF